MQQFIPFEDEWDLLERLSPESLIPYHVGVPCRHDLADGPASGASAPSLTSSAMAAVPLLGRLSAGRSGA